MSVLLVIEQSVHFWSEEKGGVGSPGAGKPAVLWCGGRSAFSPHALLFRARRCENRGLQRAQAEGDPGVQWGVPAAWAGALLQEGPDSLCVGRGERSHQPSASRCWA